MKLFHLVVSACISLFFYCLLSVIWGAGGNQEYLDLVDYHVRLEQSIAELEINHDQLSSELERISNEPDCLAEEAHRIGMVGTQQILVKTAATFSLERARSATIAEKPSENALPKPLLFGMALGFGTLILLILTIYNFEASLGNQRNTQRRNPYAYQGVRVQTASRE